MVFQPTRVGLLSLGSTWATLETWIDSSFSTRPPGWPGRGLVWRLATLRPCTTTRLSAGITLSTAPVLPLSLPVITTTLSPFLILKAAMSQHLRRQADDLHVALGAQLARHRPEDAGADRLV